ncbi:MAG: alkaline phosphatase [Rubrivivax sp.]|nr:alkaline phosphatase [Rubrivivax sp.]
MVLSPRFAPMLACLAAAAAFAGGAHAAPTVTRLTPPSELFTSGRPEPMVARFLPGQRFDLQATVRPDAGQRIVDARFFIDGKPVSAPHSMRHCASGCRKEIPAEAAVATVRAVSLQAAGPHELSVQATQTDGQRVGARGNFEIVPYTAARGPRVKNIIILVGDGMGIAQRTAARIVLGGYAQGKATRPLAMDTFPVTALVKTASLDSIVTDSAPGMTAYVSGNKNNNYQMGVFPDDTLDDFDNPRIEYLAEYLHRTQGKALGLVTTADVFDATPAGNAVHTSRRGAGAGIVDQFFDDRGLTGLAVLMGGGRQWFLPAGVPGSARSDRHDYAFSAAEPHTTDLVRRWGAAPGALDSTRDLLAEFSGAGFAYVATKTELDAVDARRSERLLGLFAAGHMSVAMDKIDARRRASAGAAGPLAADADATGQPMLEEMTAQALAVLARQPKGFVLMVEAASIDKLAHGMDTERWLLDTLEFDRAVAVVQDFARRRGDTLVIVTADHECSGAAVIGASRVTDAQLVELAAAGGTQPLRDKVVGLYEQAGFPRYAVGADGYPQTTDIDHRLLIGYGANADRAEAWRTPDRAARSAPGQPMVTGQVPGRSASHTGTDVALSACGPGASAFTGVLDNTDIFFKLAQAAVKGPGVPAFAAPPRATTRRP